jgi:hypothetical protein
MNTNTNKVTKVRTTSDNALIDAVSQDQNRGGAYTANGALSNASTLSKTVDYFAKGAAQRNRSDSEILNLFTSAFGEDKLCAVKTLFYFRDVRGGQGERRIFRVALNHLAQTNPEIVRKNLKNISEYGRWDDLFVLEGTSVWDDAVELIRTQLREDMENAKADKSVSVLAKWMPSINTSSKETKRLAHFFKKVFDISPKSYRKMLKNLRSRIDIVEARMASNDWDGIDYEKVPSIASKNLRNAFRKHDGVRYGKFIDAVTKGDAKINASTLFPYDLVKAIQSGGWGSRFTHDATVQAQWDNLPNYMGDNVHNGLVVADVSGSMTCNGGLPLNVCLSLAIYFAERNVGFFKDYFMTFSDLPKLQKLVGTTLADKCNNLSKAEWGMNTNLQATFDRLLSSAVRHNVPQEEMPSHLYIVSDMQFDHACYANDMTNFETMKNKFRDAGYELPQVVFWNVNAFGSDQPVTVHDTGTCLVSGCSPAILKTVIKASTLDPVGIMLDTINNERYDAIVI